MQRHHRRRPKRQRGRRKITRRRRRTRTATTQTTPPRRMGRCHARKRRDRNPSPKTTGACAFCRGTWVGCAPRSKMTGWQSCRNLSRMKNRTCCACRSTSCRNSTSWRWKSSSRLSFQGTPATGRCPHLRRGIAESCASSAMTSRERRVRRAPSPPRRGLAQAAAQRRLQAPRSRRHSHLALPQAPANPCCHPPQNSSASRRESAGRRASTTTRDAC
mmetsp:Transcript_17202/g.43984  ORF Transcript_17202/g.43984 Transcript_17202/m.43984 type:complete len:217 (+) Transcript_17202:333-983(+)